MATGLSTKLTGQIGEHLVTAELGRRGIIATPFAGNVPDIDILAHANGITGHIQVKAINKGSWQFDIRIISIMGDIRVECALPMQSLHERYILKNNLILNS